MSLYKRRTNLLNIEEYFALAINQTKAVLNSDYFATAIEAQRGIPAWDFLDNFEYFVLIVFTVVNKTKQKQNKCSNSWFRLKCG